MFQNIAKDFPEENQQNDNQNNEYYQGKQQNKKPIREILKNLFSIQNIILYTISFLISMVGFSSENLVLSISPFAISFLAAMLRSLTFFKIF